MKFKCTPGITIMLCSMFFGIGVAGFGCVYLNGNENVVRYNLIMFFFGLYVIYSIITGLIFYGKTIELGPEGCTITLLGMKQFYPWAHYETKVYQVNKGRKDTIISVKAHIIFLPRFFWKVPSAMLLCQMLYPLSGICLNYQSDHVPQIFPASKEALEKLGQWNVDIRNLPRT